MSESSDIERHKRMARTTAANVAITGLSAVGGVVTGNPVFNGEVFHSGSDALVHGGRLLIDKKGLRGRAANWLLKASMLVPAALLGNTSYQAAKDLAEGVEVPSDSKSLIVNILGASAILGCNGYAFNQMKAVDNHSDASHNSYHHALVDMVISAGYATSLFAETVGVNHSSQVGAAVFSAWGVVHLIKEAFSKKNHH